MPRTDFVQMFRFIHTADWQLGKQFSNIEEDAGAFLRSQRIETVRKIANIATEQKVDAVLVAGDVFETNLVTGKTIRQAHDAMSAFQGKWFLLPGNHDSAEPKSVWQRIKDITSSENIVILDQPKPVELPLLKTIILPAPLQRRHESRDLTQWFDDWHSDDDWIRIGLAHGSLANRLQHRGESPNTISDTRAATARLNYLALGDWHGMLEIADRTWYSGTPEPDRFKANESGNVLLVEIESASHEPQVTTIPTGHYKWCDVEHKIFHEDDIAALERGLIKTDWPAERMVVKLSLTGTVSLETRSSVDDALERLSAILRYVDADLDGLIPQATDSDLMQLEQTGFVRIAVEKLQAIAGDDTSGDQDAARRALQMLFLNYKKLEV